jgi:hypothetical protein
VADSSRVIDMEFFRGEFADRVREFSHDHDNAHVRLEVVTPNGERHDALQLRAAEAGATVTTRDARLVFVPYSRIAYIEVAILQDHRIAGFQLLVGT